MASVISAGTTAGTAIAIAGDTSGNLEFKTQAGTYTQTVPNATGTVMVSGNQPAFSAYTNTTQALTPATTVKINFQAEIFDTNSNFASSRFTPTVAGYYQLTCALNFSAATFTDLYIYKNGSLYQAIFGNYASASYYAFGTSLIYLNGTTDYAEIYIYQSGTVNVNSSQTACWFSGVMVRSA